MFIYMCGIYFTNNHNEVVYNKIKHRGPDYSVLINISGWFCGFHTLAITSTVKSSQQPFSNERIVVLCNGEIYNWRNLIAEYNLEMYNISNDCEVILYLYSKLDYNFTRLVSILDGEFALVILDLEKKEIMAARDVAGVRPLFWASDEHYLSLASELKGITIVNGQQLKPQYIYKFSKENNFIPSIIRYWKPPTMTAEVPLVFSDYWFPEEVLARTYELFTESVKMRTFANRKIGCLLSGGLDSSIVAAVASKFYPNLECFVIGEVGSPDVVAAQTVADFLGLNLHIVDFNYDHAFGKIRDVIWSIESADITTVRASTPQYLLAEWISNNTEVRVLLTGEGSDEIFGSYLYFYNAPTSKDLWQERVRLLNELHNFDCLRVDRTMAAHGLEVRTPFLNNKFIEHILSLPPNYFQHRQQGQPQLFLEKQLLRDVAKKYKLLPDAIINRKKEAFSDGVSKHPTTSWVGYLRSKYNEEDEHKKIFKDLFKVEPPTNKWMPRWTNIQDPSATFLKNYYLS